jgi:hypothetical protein
MQFSFDLALHFRGEFPQHGRMDISGKGVGNI